MATRTQSSFQTVKTEGALLPADLLKRVSDGDKEIEGLSPESYHLDPTDKINEATNRAWIACRDAWQRFQKQRAELPDSDKGTTLTRERWLLVLFRELGYGRLQTAKAFEIEGKTYALSHGWGNAPIHLISFRYDLDTTSHGVFRTSPHSLVQELLNRSDDHLWAFVSNGLQLRILRDNVSFTRPAFVEFDLEAMLEGEVYSDFLLLWLLCHQSRVESDIPEQCWLEKWHQTAKKQGTRVLDRLRDGVQQSIEAFGQGFLAHRGNPALRQKLADGKLTTQDYYQQLLRLVYRLIFLFVAEDRDLLLIPDADVTTRRRFEKNYSLTRIRRLAQRRRGTRHSDLWQGVKVVFKLLYKGEPRLGLPALGSMLFSDRTMPDLDGCELANDRMLEAVRHLAFTVERNVLRQVDYKNLGSEELGSVYESLLELHPDVNTDAATFQLSSVAGSERKTTGSYYTPSSLINCLLDSALDPVVAEALKKPNREKAILDLKVCDPACGSGHFLIAAANRLSHHLASARTGDEEPSPAARRVAFRDVVSHCIYGVDINPMAVELCKVALWLESIDPGKPLSFLDHRILGGNSLIGVTPRLLAEGIPDDAFKPITGDDKAIVNEYKRRNKDEKKGQLQLDFGAMPSVKLGNLVQIFANLAAMDDGSLEDVNAKEKKYAEFVDSTGYQSARLLADAWCAAFVWKKDRSTGDCITESWFRRIEANPHSLPPSMRDEIDRLRDQYQFFHWQLAFPDVFQVPGENEDTENEQAGWSGGFDVVLGNPPFVNVIEGGVSVRVKPLISFCSEELDGTADLAFHFVRLGHVTARGSGFVALVQPKTFLNADPAARFRQQLCRERPPNLLYVPKTATFFPGVSAYVLLMVLGTQGACCVSDAESPELATWSQGTISEANWWRAIQVILGNLADVSIADAVSLSDRFLVAASMTTGDAYAIKQYVTDDESTDGLRLITTGLIDPFVCKWGEHKCRYLGKDYTNPRILERPDFPRALNRRLQNARRPKVLIAGLADRIEAFFDEGGQCIGAVSTFSFFHADDSRDALGALCEWLNSDQATALVRAELGAASVGGGYMTLKKKTLQGLQIPKTIE